MQLRGGPRDSRRRDAAAASLLLWVGCTFDASGLPGAPEGPEQRPVDAQPAAFASCRAILEAGESRGDRVYTLDPGDGAAPFDAFCDMTTLGGGWTLALKADGASPTFAYDSALWESREPLNAHSPDRDLSEAKLGSFSRTPVSEVLLSFETPPGAGQLRSVRFDVTADSLHALFAGGAFEPVSAGRDAWLEAVPGADLQPNCNREGFNNGGEFTRVRLGILGNNEDDCDSNDSRLGLGGGGCGVCSHCDSGPGMDGPSVGSNFKGCSAVVTFAWLHVR
jgi:hypothetical protein